MIAILGVLLIFASTVCQARVFDLKREEFASYLLFSHGQSNLLETPLTGESTASTFTEGYANISGGEFGFLYVKETVGFRFGIETVKPPIIQGYAKSSSQNKYFYVNNITVLIPKIGLELEFKTGSWYRIIGYGYYGQGTLIGKSDYTETEIAPGTDHTIDYKGSASIYGGGVAAEFSVFDTTTFYLEGGYRQATFSELKYSKDVTTFNGTYSVGDIVKTSSNVNREITMTGAMAVAGFRFYFY